MSDVIDDPDADMLPHGCITPSIIRSLADLMLWLEEHHVSMRGLKNEMPCLRRVESTADGIVATVHVGPAIGGVREKFILHEGAERWRFMGSSS